MFRTETAQIQEIKEYLKNNDLQLHLPPEEVLDAVDTPLEKMLLVAAESILAPGNCYPYGTHDGARLFYLWKNDVSWCFDWRFAEVLALARCSESIYRFETYQEYQAHIKDWEEDNPGKDFHDCHSAFGDSDWIDTQIWFVL